MNTEKFLEEIRKFLEDGTKPSDECIFFMKEHLDITNYGKLKKDEKTSIREIYVGYYFDNDAFMGCFRFKGDRWSWGSLDDDKNYLYIYNEDDLIAVIKETNNFHIIMVSYMSRSPKHEDGYFECVLVDEYVKEWKDESISV